MHIYSVHILDNICVDLCISILIRIDSTCTYIQLENSIYVIRTCIFLKYQYLNQVNHPQPVNCLFVISCSGIFILTDFAVPGHRRKKPDDDRNWSGTERSWSDRGVS